MAAWLPNTPKAREAILEAIFSRRDGWRFLCAALENKTIPAGMLSAFQRVTLVEHDRAEIRERASRRLTKPAGTGDDAFQRFSPALANPRDQAHGEQVFKENCAACHQVRGLGFAVGPDLGAEFQRAEEAILKDILAPSETISAGFSTYVVETKAGQSFNGVLASESATSVTLRQAAGLDQTVLRKDIARVFSLPVSLMPDPAQTPSTGCRGCCRPSRSGTGGPVSPDPLVLFDEEHHCPAQRRRQALEANQPFSGKVSLRLRYSVTQRGSPLELPHHGSRGLASSAICAWPENGWRQRRHD